MLFRLGTWRDTGVDAVGDKVTYKEFQQGVRPKGEDE